MPLTTYSYSIFKEVEATQNVDSPRRRSKRKEVRAKIKFIDKKNTVN
jgi:hypothetical protein